MIAGGQGLWLVLGQGLETGETGHPFGIGQGVQPRGRGGAVVAETDPALGEDRRLDLVGELGA